MSQYTPAQKAANGHPDFADWKPSDPRLARIVTDRLTRAKTELEAVDRLLDEQEENEQFFRPDTLTGLRGLAVEVEDYADMVKRKI